jgi:hypothetical protein
MPLKEILASQNRWARSQWPCHVGRRAPSLEANLFISMAPSVQKQFANGSGGELGNHKRPGKMYSLRSSSALTYNFFAPWLGHDLGPLVAALGHKAQDGTLQFERKFRHGLSSTPPNLDVTLDNDQVRPLGVECKFTEPYGPMVTHAPLDQKYFAGGKARWSDQGLPRCQELAVVVGRTVKFKRLAAGQLLKHILGLAWTTQNTPRLTYLWFDTQCEEAAEHRADLSRFAAYIDPGVEFTALSYQEAFAKLKGYSEPEQGYFEYLASRYLL